MVHSSNIHLVWHRRDLRLDDNPALAAAVEQAAVAPGGTVAGLFIFDPTILKHPDTGATKVDFMLGCLRELQEGYRTLGSDLLLFYGDPVAMLRQVAIALHPQQIFYNRDVEPFAIHRDRAAKEALAELGVVLQGYNDIGLHDPRAIATGSKEPYKVYTPFWKKWIAQAKPSPYVKPSRLAIVPHLERVPSIPLPSLRDLDFSHDRVIPIPGEAEGLRLLREFCDSQAHKLLRYKEGRDFPAQEGTSRLSPHLRFGTVGIRRVWKAVAIAKNLVRSDEEATSLQTWQQELAWREFYQHVLFHFPQLAESAYRPQMQRFVWDDRRDWFQAWCEGKTGYPIVDAAMRQLNATGWMHNRCRMIVASFLTKDLLINWQWGERYFMQKLIDGDLTANNGGWQWSASSGMDPKPLRIFNPASQARKYDPEAEYIRMWLPELSSLTTAELVNGIIAPHECRQRDYPLPLVNHNEQQQRFKQRYQDAKL